MELVQCGVHSKAVSFQAHSPSSHMCVRVCVRVYAVILFGVCLTPSLLQVCFSQFRRVQAAVRCVLLHTYRKTHIFLLKHCT